MTNKNFKNSCLTAWQWCYCVSLRAPRLQRSPSCHPERVSSVSLYTRQPWFSADGGSIGNPRAIFLFFLCTSFWSRVKLRFITAMHISHGPFLCGWSNLCWMKTHVPPSCRNETAASKTYLWRRELQFCRSFIHFVGKSWVSNALTV